MAKPTTRPLRKNKKTKTALGRLFQSSFGRLFAKRSLIIISGHKTQHVPFSGGLQACAFFGLLALVAWGAFSSGSYVTAQQQLAEKEKKLASFAFENERVASEFSMLKQDLMKLAEAGKGNKTAEMAKEMVEQYSAATPEQPSVGGDDLSEKYSAVFNRIQFLENKVRDLQANHDAMVADIRATTGGKIKELENVIARVGVAPAPLVREAEVKRKQAEQAREKYGRTLGDGKELPDASGGAQGGPFTPATSVLKEKETELYFDLRKLMTLNDVVQALPLAEPFATNYRKSSGFGTRVDPFRGVLSFHAGADFAAPSGTKVLATNDGRVDFAGWKTAYGNVVDVKHEYGFSTRYGHLRQILVRPGQFVKKGQAIAVQGSTGRSTGEHLHYEVRYNDKPINPTNFLKAGADVRALN